MEFTLHLNEHEVYEYNSYYTLENSLGLLIDIIIINENNTTYYVVVEWMQDLRYQKEIGGFKSLSKAKKRAKEYLMDKAFGERFMKSKNKGKKVVCDRS